MIAEAQDFLDECEALHALVTPLSAADMTRATAFKGWSVDRVIRHLHMFNWAADLTLRDGPAFQDWFAGVAPRFAAGDMVGVETDWAEGLSGPALTEAWIAFAREMTPRFAAADPKARVAWAGPDMSARSCITARLMETWAHGQAIYDLMGVRRPDADRIRAIVHLGVNTYGWSFRVNGREAPEPMPFLRLVAPSGAIWTYGEENDAGRIAGSATEFCQVVAQTRNIADTALRVAGPNATEWMRIAQCFAGPPETPPPPGTRGPA